MGFCQEVLIEDTSKGSTYISPLMHYLAVCDVDASSGHLRSAFTYTPILGHTLWIVRLIMLEVAVPLVGWPILGLQSRVDIVDIP